MAVTCSDTRYGLFWKGCNIGQSGSLVEAISKGGVHRMYFLLLGNKSFLEERSGWCISVPTTDDDVCSMIPSQHHPYGYLAHLTSAAITFQKQINKKTPSLTESICLTLMLQGVKLHVKFVEIFVKRIAIC